LGQVDGGQHRQKGVIAAVDVAHDVSAQHLSHPFYQGNYPNI